MGIRRKVDKVISPTKMKYVEKPWFAKRTDKWTNGTEIHSTEIQYALSSCDSKGNYRAGDDHERRIERVYFEEHVFSFREYAKLGRPLLLSVKGRLTYQKAA